MNNTLLSISCPDIGLMIICVNKHYIKQYSNNINSIKQTKRPSNFNYINVQENKLKLNLLTIDILWVKIVEQSILES